jgi:hypothetical protein
MITGTIQNKIASTFVPLSFLFSSILPVVDAVAFNENELLLILVLVVSEVGAKLNPWFFFVDCIGSD